MLGISGKMSGGPGRIRTCDTRPRKPLAFVCGVPSSIRCLDCHESWEWDDESGVQRLVALVALCERCHRVKHSMWLAPLRGRPEGFYIGWRLHYDREFIKQVLEDLHRDLLRPEQERDAERIKKLSVEHFLEVNRCDLVSGERHVLSALEDFRRRARLEWRV